jgi:hypothetical protein
MRSVNCRKETIRCARVSWGSQFYEVVMDSRKRVLKSYLVLQFCNIEEVKITDVQTKMCWQWYEKIKLKLK